MSLFRLTWITSCLGILLGLSHWMLTDSRLISPPTLAHWLNVLQPLWETSSLPQSQLVLVSPQPEALVWKAEKPASSPDRPIEVALTHIPDAFSTWDQGFEGLEINSSPLAGKTLSWQARQEDSFCLGAIATQAQWSKVPEAPRLAQSYAQAIAQRDLRTRVVQIVANILSESETASMTRSTQPIIRVQRVVNGQVRKLTPQNTFQANRALHWLTWRSSPKTPSDREEFRLLVNGKTVMTLAERQHIEYFAQRLTFFLEATDFDPSEIQPRLLGGYPAGVAGDRILFIADEKITPLEEPNRELMVIHWVNDLRAALGDEPLSLVEAQQSMYGLVETRQEFEGLASWYGPYFHGRLTANGEIYDQEAFTAAHPSLPFNTYLKVTNLESQETVIVRINDRGPYVQPRTLDLSRGVARCLESKTSGVVPYRAVVMESYSQL